MLQFPNFRQTFDYDCGATAIQAVLAYYGINFRKDKIIKLAYTKPIRGTSMKGIRRVAEKYGFKLLEKSMTIKEVKKFIDKKIPVILALQAWNGKKRTNWKKTWKEGHYVVAIGYDVKKIYFEDPADIRKTHLNYSELEDRWHDKDGFSGKKYIHHGVVLLGKKPAHNLHKSVQMD